MPSLSYERNKENILRWRVKHREQFLEAARQDAKKYYDAHAETIKAKKRTQYHEKKAALKSDDPPPTLAIF